MVEIGNDIPNAKWLIRRDMIDLPGFTRLTIWVTEFVSIVRWCGLLADGQTKRI